MAACWCSVQLLQCLTARAARPAKPGPARSARPAKATCSRRRVSSIIMFASDLPYCMDELCYRDAKQAMEIVPQQHWCSGGEAVGKLSRACQYCITKLLLDPKSVRNKMRTG